MSSISVQVEITIIWKDSDGDTLGIDTNEELAIALDDSPGPVHKFWVNYKWSQGEKDPFPCI